MKLGSYETAKQYFYDVLASKPPEPVRKNIDMFLATIAGAERTNFFSGIVSTSVNFDDNARSVPLLLDFGGTAVVKPVKDSYFSHIASLNHIHKFQDTPWAWKTTFTGLYNTYNRYHELDVGYYGITSGPAYQKANYLLELHGGWHDLTYNYDEYVQPTSVGGSGAWAVSDNLILNTAVEISNKRYAKASDSDLKNATNLIISLAPIFIEGNNRFTFSMAKEFENARSDSWSYTRWQWGLNFERLLADDASVSAGLTIKRTDYDGASVQRADREYDINLGVDKTLWRSMDKKRHLTARLNFTHTRAKSNVILYDYRKNVFATTVSYGF
jgi:hypothetical protein